MNTTARRTLYLLFLFPWLLWLMSCRGPADSPSSWLVRVDSLLDENPDSALRMLQTVSPVQWENKDEQAYYGLLLLQAKFKNYLPLKDDALARELVAYYEKTGNRSMLARACYNLGCVYEDREEPDRAFKAYYEAAQLARREDDARTLCRTYNNLAYICQNQEMPRQADSLYAEVEHLARQTGDSVRLAEALLRRGVYQLSLGEAARPRAGQLIRQGYVQAQNLHSPSVLHLAFVSLYLFHRYQKQDKEALDVAGRFANLPLDSATRSRACLLVGDAYWQQAQYDSATVYLMQALNSGSYLVKEKACALLARISQKEGKWKESVRWNDEQERYQREQRNLQHATKVAVAAREVELSEVLRSQWAGSFIPYFYITGGIVVCLGVLVGVVIRRKKPHPVVHEEIREERQEWDFAAYKQAVRQTASFAAIMGVLDCHDKQVGGHLEHWGEEATLKFCQEVEPLLPGFQKALQKKYPALDVEDIFFCLLYLAGFKDKQISVLIERNKSTVIRRRQMMLRKKMGCEQADADDLLKACKQVNLGT